MLYSVLFIVPPESGVKVPKKREMFGLCSYPQNILLTLSDGVRH